METTDEQIIASPVHAGNGHVHCVLMEYFQIPAPKTAYILSDVIIYRDKIEGELCTPTRAVLLKFFVTKFDSMPAMKIQAIGYGI